MSGQKKTIENENSDQVLSQNVLIGLAKKRGSVGAIWRLIAQHPELARRLGSLGELLRFTGELSPMYREAIVLTTAASENCDYIVQHHLEPAKDAGLTDSEIQKLTDVDCPLEELPRHLQVAHVIARNEKIDSAQKADVYQIFDTKQFIEALTLAGYYRVIAKLVLEFCVNDSESN